MTKHRVVIAVFAVVGALLGGIIGAFAAPHASRYTTSANVALLPAPDLTTVEASNFWEVLTRGQVTRTAALVYDDPRWLPSAAKAANVSQRELTLTAAAVPETTMLVVTVTADSPGATEAALNDVLNAATANVTSLVQPYVVKVLWPPQGSAVRVPEPSRVQVGAAAALGGLLIGGGLGWFFWRRRTGAVAPAGRPSELVDEAPAPR